jgi:hypothetical protein
MNPKPRGRNDSCWCGSGLKYKRCHLSIQQRLAKGQPAGVPTWQARDRALELLVRLQKALSNENDAEAERRATLELNEQSVEQLLTTFSVAAENWESLKHELVGAGMASATQFSSPLEPPETQSWLNLCVAPVRAALAAEGHIVPNIAVGSLRTGDVNAQAIKVPGSQGAYVIVYDRGTFRYLAAAGAVFSKCIPDEFFNTPITPRIVSVVSDYAARMHEEIAEWMSSLLCNTLKGEPPEPMDLTYDRVGIMTAFSRAMVSFVLAHEYSHVVLGHLTGRSKGV